MASYPYMGPFQSDGRSFGCFEGTWENAYSFRTTQAGKFGLEQIEREQFSIAISVIESSNRKKTQQKEASHKMFRKNSLVGQLVDRSKSNGLSSPQFTLRHGRNRRSLSRSYQELFKKWRLLFTKKSDISCSCGQKVGLTKDATVTVNPVSPVRTGNRFLLVQSREYKSRL